MIQGVGEGIEQQKLGLTAGRAPAIMQVRSTEPSRVLTLGNFSWVQNKIISRAPLFVMVLIGEQPKMSSTTRNFKGEARAKK